MERIKKRYFKKKIVFFATLVIVNLIFYSICYFSSTISTKQIIRKEISNLSFNSVADKPHTVFTKSSIFYHAFSLKFESDFLPKDDNYGNIFQTESDPKTLRIELIHPTSLQAIVGYKDDPGLRVYPISGKVRMNSWNHIKLIYSSNKELYIKLNNEPSVSLSDDKFDVAINDLVLGTGFDRQRSFTGMIKNANFGVVFNETNILLYSLGLLSKYYFILILFQLVFLYAKTLKGQSVKIKARDYRDLFFGFLITFSVVALVVLALSILVFPLTGQRKWLPYLGLLIPAIALGMNYFKINVFNSKYFLIIAGLFYFVLLALGIHNYEFISWFGISSVLIICCCLSVIPIMRSFSFIFAGIFIFLFSINSVVFLNNYEMEGYVWTALIVAVVMCAFLLALSSRAYRIWWDIVNNIGFAILLVISFVFSLRSDSLFLGSAEFHWNYYTGVIQTIRSGGELLWSAPSQYGFLSLLLPSFLPWTSRDSFFIFQAGLLFICSVIIIKSVRMCFRHPASFVVISLAGLSLFYFADPSLIGPALFPSSSVMRFFWVYILIYTILVEYCRGNLLNGRIKWFVVIVYILGALWSAESFLYCSAMYATYLVSSAVLISKLKVKKTTATKFLFFNILVVLIVFFIFNLSYLAIVRHFPDWSMFFMYAFSYAKGYGELAIKPWGLYWAIIIVLSSIVFILSRLYSAKKYSEWIVFSVCLISLWVLSSYYVGRAVSNNFTAILPIIFYIFIIMLAVLTKSKLFTYRMFLGAVFLPWIVVGIIAGFGNPQFVQKIQEFKYAENIDSKSFKPDKDLGSILESLEVTKGTRIVYYGDPYSNPVIPLPGGGYLDPVSGMPIPLTLLEEPISENRRSIVVNRFLHKTKEPFYFISKRDEYSTKINDWEKFLGQEYKLKKIKVIGGIYDVSLVNLK